MRDTSGIGQGMYGGLVPHALGFLKLAFQSIDYYILTLFFDDFTGNS